MSLIITHLSKSFGSTRALQDISLEVSHGEIVALLGPSGCGKSTLLNIIAGIENPESGELSWENQPLRDIPVHRRGFGLMFQDYALFPHMTVAQNTAFGLKMAKWEAAEIETRVNAVLELVGLRGYEKRDVGTLSGGEQQRAALARSLAPKPKLLMLDEPLGSLDRSLREQLLVELKKILQETRQTALYVTHDQEEAFALADRIAVMQNGAIAQIGTPQTIFRQPATSFVARFLGFENIFEGLAHRGTVETPLGVFAAPSDLEGKVEVLIRPDTLTPGSKGPHQLEGHLTALTFRGSRCRMEVNIKNHKLVFELSSSQAPLPKPGEIIQLSYHPAETLHFFPTA